MSVTTVIHNEASQVEQRLGERLTTHTHWALRIALASVFIYHGAQKLGGVEGFAQMMNLTYATALAVALAEFVGGILIVAGGFTRAWVTRLGAALFIPVMARRPRLAPSGGVIPSCAGCSSPIERQKRGEGFTFASLLTEN